MKEYKLAQGEAKFADLIWANAPIASMELVKLSEKEMGWKKPTTFTVLRKLCQKGLFKNENSIVSVVMTKDEYLSEHSRFYIEDTFGGSLPKFLTSVMGRDRLSDNQAEELKRLIDEYKED